MAAAIYLTPEGGKQIVFPMIPSKVHMGGEGKFLSYDIIKIGEVKLPRGSSLMTVSWNNAILPGSKRKSEIYVKSWSAPNDIISTIRTAQVKGTKCRLLVTGTRINLDVYIQKFEGDYQGGHGDFFYSIKFLQARDVKIYTYANSGSGSGTSTKKPSNKRPDPKPNTDTNNRKTRTVTVKRGDSLWALAQRYLGNGARYREIYNLNKATINRHHGGPNMIWPGDRLKIPAK